MEEKKYLCIYWNSGKDVDVYQLSQKGIEAYKNGMIEDYVKENLGYDVHNYATYCVLDKKPSLHIYKQEV